MCPSANTSPSQTFIHELRNALNHLYDPDFLRASPLVGILGTGGRFDSPSSLQDILTRAIESLKPAPNAPNKLHAQAIYDLLLFRYVQQFNQNEIANQLGISVRHLRRQQNLAIYELGCRLWDQYDLGARQNLHMPGDISTPGDQPTQDTFVGELDWLKQQPGQVATDISFALDEARLLILPFAEQNDVRLEIPALPAGMVQVHPVAFQQVLLSLLMVAIQHAPGSKVELASTFQEGWLTLTIRALNAIRGKAGPAGEQKSLDTVHRMVELSRGLFSYESTSAQFLARIAFRSVDPITVLVIDDNQEIITMMQRFVAETRYRILGLTDPNQAIEQALHIDPDMIVLDIMMPQIDGLQLLSRFKHHPRLGKVPVIICSVLPQKDLAASLGAVSFIQKPIQRETFISSLNEAGGLLDKAKT